MRNTRLNLHVFAYLDPDIPCPYKHRGYDEPNGDLGSYYTKDLQKIHRLRIDRSDMVRLVRALKSLRRDIDEKAERVVDESTPLLLSVQHSSV